MFLIIIFVFGLCAGSFLNVIIYRLPKNERIFGRSCCPYCKKTIAWYDLIPGFSFCRLLGKCRFCRKKISWQYPIVEIATGALFLLIFNELQILNFQNLPSVCYLFFVACSLIVIFVIDLKHYIVPDEIIYPAIIFTIFFRLFENWKLGIGNLQLLLSSLLSGFLAAAFFLAIVLVSKGKWMGLGDVKLAGFLGLFLSWPKILPALFVAFLLGAIMGLGLIGAGKKTLKSEIPFGPFLIIGGFIAFFWGQNIVNWYFKLI